jgi:anti-sigma factor RsiW
VNETDLDTLECWLDGELPPEDVKPLQARLGAEPELSTSLATLQQEREIRQRYFTAIEPDNDALARTLDRVHAAIAQRRRWAWQLHFARVAGAIAACIAIGFAVGWIGRGGMNGSIASPRATPHVYQVNISDEAGRVIGVQNFPSADQAREFSEDLKRWQEQQDQIRNGAVIVRSASF